MTVIAVNGIILSDSHAIASKMDNHRNKPEIIQAREAGKGVSTRFSRILEGITNVCDSTCGG
jgi:hypothetical protein